MRKGSKSSARLRTHVWLPSLNFRVSPRPAHTRRSLFSDHLQREIARGTCPCTLSPATTWYVWESDTAINGGRRAAPNRQMWYRARGAIVGSVKYGPTELRSQARNVGAMLGEHEVTPVEKRAHLLPGEFIYVMSMCTIVSFELCVAL